MKAAIVLFFSLLSEKQRRLYAELEPLKLGYAGGQKDGPWVDKTPRSPKNSDLRLWVVGYRHCVPPW